MEQFLAQVLTNGIDLRTYLNAAAREMGTDNDRVASLKGEAQEAEAGLKRVADAVADGALDEDAARETTLELREKRERATKRLPLSPLARNWARKYGGRWRWSSRTCQCYWWGWTGNGCGT